MAVPEHQITSILEVPGVSWIIRHNGKPAELHPREYDVIVRFIETGLLIETFSVDHLEMGEEVEVMDGPLKGLNGFVSGMGKEKFTVILDALGQAIRVEINPLVLRKRG